MKSKKLHIRKPLSDLDMVVLQDALKPRSSPDEFCKGKTLLEQKAGLTFVSIQQAEAFSKSAKKGPKRGPKPEPSTNSTDRQEAANLDAIRQTLGAMVEDLTKLQLLSLVRGLCGLLQSRRESGLFLTRIQRQSLHLIATQGETLAPALARRQSEGELSLGSSITVSPTCENVEKLLRGLNKSVWIDASKQTWDKTLADAIISAKRVCTKTSTEVRMYSVLRRLLELELPAREVRAIYGGIKSRQRGRSRKTSDQLGPGLTYRQLHPKLAVPHVLEKGQEALLLLKRLIKRCWFCPYSIRFERLYLLIRAWCSNNHPDAVPHEVATIDAIFLDAAYNQGVSPFPPTSNEELSLGPPDDSM